MCVFKYHAFIFYIRPPRWRCKTVHNFCPSANFCLNIQVVEGYAGMRVADGYTVANLQFRHQSDICSWFTVLADPNIDLSQANYKFVCRFLPVPVSKGELDSYRIFAAGLETGQQKVSLSKCLKGSCSWPYSLCTHSTRCFWAGRRLA